MKALLYKKWLDERLSILLTLFLLAIFFYIGVENQVSGFVWLAFIGKNDSKEEWSYFRTMNFTRKSFYQATITFNIMKLILRLLMVAILTLLFKKTLSNVLYFISFLSLFFIIETTGDLLTFKIDGKEEKFTK